jgi:tetratricopeptide (TPR) repeat protein
VFHFLRRFAFKSRAPESEIEPTDSRGLNARGVRRIREGLRDQARADFEAALAIDPRHAPALMNMGNLAFEADDPAGSVRWYEAAIEADPDYPAAHANLAAAYKRLGRFDEAVAAMRRCLKLEGRPRRKPSRPT